jgi:hypothetical protein
MLINRSTAANKARRSLTGKSSNANPDKGIWLFVTETPNDRSASPRGEAGRRLARRTTPIKKVTIENQSAGVIEACLNATLFCSKTRSAITWKLSASGKGDVHTAFLKSS